MSLRKPRLVSAVLLTELATKVRDLFTIVKPGDQISDGIADFEILLAKARVADYQRLEKDPNARHLEVEDVMTTLPGDDAPIEAVEFESNLARARAADVRRLLKDPRAERLEVEDAMIVTIEKNGIPLPDTFFTVASGFRPKYPPKR